MGEINPSPEETPLSTMDRIKIRALGEHWFAAINEGYSGKAAVNRAMELREMAPDEPPQDHIAQVLEENQKFIDSLEEQ